MKTPINVSYRKWAALAGAALLTVQQAFAAATLVHRYDFSNDGSGTNLVDMVGGAAWNGHLPNGGTFDSTTNQLSLDVGNEQYVQFPPGIISNYMAVTIDAWAVISNPWGFLWAFGDTDPDTTFGGHAIWLNCQAARLTITDTMPSWGGEQNCFFGGLGDRGYVHVTAVVDPPHNKMVVYTNGVLAGVNLSETRSLTNVYSIYNYLGKSVFSGDSLIPLTLDEFRIFNGAMTGMEAAGYDVAGPDSLAGTIGTMTNLIVTAPYAQLVQGGHETISITGQSTLFVDAGGNAKPISVDNNLCTYSSDNTSILTVNTNGTLNAIRPGTANVTAHYGAVAGAVAITVFPEPVVLMHRYSFNNADDGNGNTSAVLSDSVGGSSFDGSLPNGGTFSDGQLVLSGGSSQYANLATNLFSGMTNVTFDIWTTFPSGLPWNAWFFGFGDMSGDSGGNYFFVQPQSGSFVMAGISPGWLGEIRASAGRDWSGQTMHLTCVASTGGGYLTLYTNGVLAAVNNGLTYAMSNIVNNYSFINRSLYSGDPYVDNTINELRIYSGAVSADWVALSQAAGPDVLPGPTLSIAPSASSLLVSWPTSPSGFTLYSTTNLNGGAWTVVGATPTVSGINYQVVLPPTNAIRFFKLSK
jgi:hypothetical protein